MGGEAGTADYRPASTDPPSIGTARSGRDRTTIRGLVRESLLPICLVDLASTKIIEASEPLAQLLGGRHDQVAKRHAIDFVVDKAAARSRLSQLAAGELDSYHVRGRAYRRLDGAEMTADTCVSALANEIPRQTALVVIAPTGSPMPALVIGPPQDDRTTLGTVDEAWRIDRISADVEELLGYPASDLVGQRFANIVEPRDWPVLLIAVGHSLRDDGGTGTRLHLRTADGNSVLSVAFVTPVAGGASSGFAFSLTSAQQATTVADRAWELEMHLRRIAREVASSGVLTALTVTPPATSLPAMSGLSARELEIVTRLLAGERVPMIANGMFLSQSTVRNHLTSVYRKLGVRSQQELITLLRGTADDSDRGSAEPR